MILENISINSVSLLINLAAETYNKKHKKLSYFENNEQLTNAIIKECPKYGVWWAKHKQNSNAIYYCYIKTNGKNIDPAIERCSDWLDKTLKLDSSIISSAKARAKRIKNHTEILEINMDKDIEYSQNRARSFYNSDEWRRLRYFALKESCGKCCLCGRSAKDGVVLHVDHIIPISVAWGLRNKKSNLQVLCSECNIGKSNKDITDWR